MGVLLSAIHETKEAVLLFRDLNVFYGTLPVPFPSRTKNKRDSCESLYLESGSDLSSRAVSSQVLSALKGLTSVFGMGTGVTPSSLPPEIVNLFCRFPLPFSPRHFPLHVVPGFRACGRGQRAFRSPSALLRVAPISGFPFRVLWVSFVMRLFPHPDNCTVGDSVFTLLTLSVVSCLLPNFDAMVSVSCAKSSPRPISIIKLHTLLRFHR